MDYRELFRFAKTALKSLVPKYNFNKNCQKNTQSGLTGTWYTLVPGRSNTLYRQTEHSFWYYLYKHN